MRSRPLFLVAAAALIATSAACSTSGDDDVTGPSGPGSGAAGATGGEGQGGSTGGSGGSGGDGGQIIVENSGEDTCPGDPFDLTLGATLVLKGTTADATDDYASFCGDVTPQADNPDRVYEITIADAGTLIITQDDAATFLPAITIRTTCDDDMTAFYCFEFLSQQKITKQHIEPGTYFVFIDGKNGEMGEYSFTIDLDESMCGDGVLAPAEEQCDPIPVSPDDGCTDPGDALGGCKFEMPDVVKDTCPGENHPVTTAGLTLLATDGNTTLGYTDDYAGTCMGSMGGKDRVYELVPQTAGTMTVTIGFEADGVTETCMVNPGLEGCWDYALHARTTCTDVGTEVDCSDTAAPEALSFPVTAMTPYYVVVDGYDGESYSDGTYNLVITLQ